MQKKVRAAEDEARSKALLDRGINDQPQACVADSSRSVNELRHSAPDAAAKRVMNLVTLIQYFDMLKKIGVSSRTNGIVIPHAPGNLTMPTEQDRNAMMEADQTAKASDSAMALLPALTNASSYESRVHRQSHLRDLARNIQGNSIQKSSGADDDRE